MYVPGMFSLVLIPLFCLYYFYSQKAFDEYRCIAVGLAGDRDFREIKAKYGFPIPRNYEEFAFNGSEALEVNTFTSLKRSLQKLKDNNDTINGVKIHLGAHSHYAAFIKALEILQETDMPTYLPYKNDIWVLIGNKQKKRKTGNSTRMFCGTQDVINNEKLRLEELKKENDRKQFQISFFKNRWPLFLGYLGIVVLNVFTLIKFNKKRKHNQKSYI